MKRLFCGLLAASLILTSCGASRQGRTSESAFGKLPELADMDLCYGGSSHRNPYKWDKERFAPHVSYVDEAGKEHWLFESFLAIEFIDWANCMTYQAEYNPNTKHLASDKASWLRLLDYWFEEGYGFDALDAAVEDVKGRIGKPKSKRFVIMTIPDPVINKHFAQKDDPTVYWGELEGRQMDFGCAEDRCAALRWYVDETIRRFEAKKYDNLEFIGFYIISEDLAKTDDGTYGWSAYYKRYDEIFPATADYIHSQGKGLYWIPYHSAGGYQFWREYGIDLAIMQPGHFWHPEKSLPRFVEMVRDYDMGMELELDDELFGPDPERYRQSLRDYFTLAKENGFYGTKPFAMYAGTNTFTKLSKSEVPEEKALFRELCEFLLHNPLKKY